MSEDSRECFPQIWWSRAELNLTNATSDHMIVLVTPLNRQHCRYDTGIVTHVVHNIQCICLSMLFLLARGIVNGWQGDLTGFLHACALQMNPESMLGYKKSGFEI